MYKVATSICFLCWLSLLALIWLFIFRIVPFNVTNWLMFILFLIIAAGSAAASHDNRKFP